MSIPSKIKSVYERATCMFTAQEVETALDKMAVAIHEKLHDKNPILVCVMKGGLITMGNLLPRLDFHLEVEYVHATRYKGDITGSDLQWRVRPTDNLKGRNVLVVDDILDGGITLSSIIDSIKAIGAEHVYSAVLVDKYNKRVPHGLKNADFVGLEIDDHYIFGYGMDYHEYLRNAPGIYVVHPDDE